MSAEYSAPIGFPMISGSTRKNGRFGLITLRSSWPSIPTRLLLCRSDIARHAASLFDEGHHPVRDEGADEVEDRDGQVGLDPPLGVLLHLAGLGGGVQHPEGERHGRV